MISSELPEVLGMSDRIYVMNEGRIVGELDASRGIPGSHHGTNFEFKQRRIVMSKENVSAFLKKYTMVIVLVVVTLFFTWKTGGRMLLPQNVNNLISQNSYVFILATGMLLCILTGGNIDLSVGSVVCFAGAVGATFMVNKGMSVGISILIMLVTGLAIGAWQGFWIAYRRIPPFIVTLAGMLIFRGLSNIILNGFTIAPMPDAYLALFNNYIVDVFHGNGINITCILAGIIIKAVFVLMTFKGRMSKIKKGYKVGPAVNDIVKCAVISIVIIAFMWRLAQYKGIPMILIWVALIVLIYGYLTSKTTVGRHLYAIGGNEKASTAFWYQY